jgi:hypothetical protein
MAQFNQLQTSASQVINPPAGYVSFHYDENERLAFFDSTGFIVMSSSILAESASVAEKAHSLTPGNKRIAGDLVINGDLQAESLTLSSSVLSVLTLDNSGSSIFGNDLQDTHQFTGSFSITGSTLIKGNTVLSGSTIISGSLRVISGSISGSSATINQISSSDVSILTASINNLTILGTASIKYLNVDFQSSSVIFSSGSNIFGDAQNDNQQFTGSVGITGSTFSVNTTGATPEFQVTGTGTKTGNTLTDSHQVTGSVEITGSTFRVLTTGTNPEFQVLGNGVRLGNVLTDSHELTGSLCITGSTLSVGNIGIVAGLGSFSGSGANLYDISASSIVGLNLSRISTGSVSVSANINNSIQLSHNTTITGSLLVQSSSAGPNIIGTASWAVDSLFGAPAVVVSASFPTSQRNVNTGTASGSLWWNTDDGNLYIQAAGPSGSTWVPATSTVAGGEYGATTDFTFATAATTWSINHGFGTTTPIVQFYTGSQMLIPASVRAVDANNLQVTFATATHGVAKVSTGVGGATSASFAVMASDLRLARTASYLNDAAAAADGVPLFGVYRSASFVLIRTV